MSVSGELFYHQKEMQTSLLGNAMQSPSHTPNVLAPYARYTTEAPGLGLGINDIVGAANSQWYHGRDELKAQEELDDPVRHFATWSNMMTPISMDFLKLHKITNIDGATFLSDSFSLNRLDQKGRNAYFSNLKVAVRQALYGGRLDYDRSLWGDFENTDFEGRTPESIDKLFDENSSWHGLRPDELGSFDRRHPLGKPEAQSQFPGWDQRHKPRVYHFNSTDGRGGKPPSGTDPKQLTPEKRLRRV